MARRAKAAGLPIVNARAAAIDIGSRFHVVAVPPDRCDESVQTFQAFTGDLHRMAAWLTGIGVSTVAMESTGVYWVAVRLPPNFGVHSSARENPGTGAEK